MRAGTVVAALPSVERGRMRGWSEVFGRFLRLAGPYWSSERHWKVRGLTATLLVLTVAQVVFPVALNIWTQNLFDALTSKSLGRFLLLLLALLAIITGDASVTSLHLWVKRRLQIDWREWLTTRVVGEWMESGRQYQVTQIPGEHDNPDGRIAEDIRIGTEYAIDLAHSLLYCVLLLASFTQILWSLSGSPEITLGGIELYVPGHLVWVALIYASVGSAVALLLGRPLVRATDHRQTAEANFRFVLVHARENAPAIALARGEVDERRRFAFSFRGAIDAWDRQSKALVSIFYYISSWSVLSQAFPVLVAAPRYIAGTITLGTLMQIAQGFQQATAALSWPIDNLPKLADWRASAERVLGLHESLERVAAHGSVGRSETIDLHPGSASRLLFDDLAISEPDGTVALMPFSAEIGQGERVLIAGDSGAAVKLFKAVAGLWPWGRGRIELPAQAAIFFMPQRPYLPIGPLRDAVRYPSLAAPEDDAAAAAALARVGLADIASRLGDSENWEQVLTPGEQQRLGFARLLLRRPGWIFIQEATDAIDPAGERALMSLIEDEFPRATVITIGQREALQAHHRRKFLIARAAAAPELHETGLLEPARM